MKLTRFLTTADLADLLQVTPRTVERWRADGTGPSFVMIGRQIRYPPGPLNEWLRENARPASKKATPSAQRTPRTSRPRR